MFCLVWAIDPRLHTAGGTSIEDLAEKYPEKIIKIPIDIFEGITDDQAKQMVDALEIKGDKAAAAKQIKALYKCFTESDCTMVEVSSPERSSNPLCTLVADGTSD